MDYISERGFNLIAKVPNVLTVEDYCKWYDLYVTKEDGTSVPVCDYEDQVGDIFLDQWLDHCITPKGAVEIAKVLNIKLGSVSYNAICQMFIEQEDYENLDEIDECYLPEADDLKGVLVDDAGVCTYFKLK